MAIQMLADQLGIYISGRVHNEHLAKRKLGAVGGAAQGERPREMCVRGLDSRILPGVILDWVVEDQVGIDSR